MLQNKGITTINGRHYYSESFKKFVVKQVEQGKLGKEEAKLKYNIAGNSSVLNWCRKYGKFTYNNRVRNVMSTINSDAVLKRRIKDLEKELSETKLKVNYLECVIEVANEEMRLDIGKKSGTVPSIDAKPNIQGKI